MLTPSQLAAVEASLPIVAANATAITGRFYDRLFEAYPELRNLFNQGNQLSGEQKKALAGAVYAYAKNYDRREVLAPLLSRIAHKHASLGVGPEMYSIVGEHLMAAIGEILGSNLTADVADAWRCMYWRFAEDLIAREAVLHAEALLLGVHQPGAPQDLKML